MKIKAYFCRTSDNLLISIKYLRRNHSHSTDASTQLRSWCLHFTFLLLLLIITHLLPHLYCNTLSIRRVEHLRSLIYTKTNPRILQMHMPVKKPTKYYNTKIVKAYRNILTKRLWNQP